MKISVEYSHSDAQHIKIESADYLGKFLVKVRFNDGKVQSIDFEPFLKKTLHPSIKKYLNKEYFSKFQICDGNLNWNDYDMIFPIWDLYQGKITE